MAIESLIKVDSDVSFVMKRNFNSTCLVAEGTSRFSGASASANGGLEFWLVISF